LVYNNKFIKFFYTFLVINALFSFNLIQTRAVKDAVIEAKDEESGIKTQEVSDPIGNKLHLACSGIPFYYPGLSIDIASSGINDKSIVTAVNGRALYVHNDCKHDFFKIRNCCSALF